MEYWDIYDKNKQLTGREMKRNDWCLKEDEYHLTVLGVIRRPDGKYLITRRVLTRHGHQAGGKFPEALHRQVKAPRKRYVVRYWKKQDWM